jgi:hypothetical protein
MKNYQSMTILSLLFNCISFNCGVVFFILSLIPTLFILLTKLGVLNFSSQTFKDFKSLLDGESKILTYIKFDYLNGPIYYILSGLIWLTCIIYLISDLVNYGEVSDDIPVMFFSISLVSLVMIFVGYIKEWYKL